MYKKMTYLFKSGQMSVGEITSDRMPLNKINFDKIILDKMTLKQIPFETMNLDKRALDLVQND
jgi:hypothetical protein